MPKAVRSSSQLAQHCGKPNRRLAVRRRVNPKYQPGGSERLESFGISSGSTIQAEQRFAWFACGSSKVNYLSEATGGAGSSRVAEWKDEFES
jgi:hypothetical protein